MANQTHKLYSHIQLRNDTEANWTAENPILLAGELILVDVQGQTRMKIGNGIDHYNDLLYYDQILKSFIEDASTKELLNLIGSGEVK